MRKLKQFFSESSICDYVEIIFDADGDLTSLNSIKVRKLTMVLAPNQSCMLKLVVERLMVVMYDILCMVLELSLSTCMKAVCYNCTSRAVHVYIRAHGLCALESASDKLK
jgi:hypothetical protein